MYDHHPVSLPFLSLLNDTGPWDTGFVCDRSAVHPAAARAESFCSRISGVIYVTSDNVAVEHHDNTNELNLSECN